MRRAAASFVLLAAVALLAGPARLASAQSAASVNVGPGLQFSPASVTIDAGGTVTWTWREGNHTVTFQDGSGDSGVRQQGATYSLQFDSAGSKQYLCTVHPELMRGTVIVRAQASPTARPTSARPSPTTASPSPSRSPAVRRTTAPPTTPPPATTPPPTTAPPSPSPTRSAMPVTAASPVSAAPSPSGTASIDVNTVGDVPPDRTAFAMIAGAVLAAAGLGGGGWLLLRMRRTG